MPFNKTIHHRRSIRLKGYDYSQNGTYFITICTKNREHLFGKIENGEMILNDFGNIAQQEMKNTEEIRKNVSVGCFVIMPNHVHAIIVIGGNDDMHDGRGVLQYAPTENPFRSPSQTVGAIVRGYKSTVTKHINILRNTPYETLWQRNYHEHIIRSEQSFEKIAEYIVHNPQNWEQDCFYDALLNS